MYPLTPLQFEGLSYLSKLGLGLKLALCMPIISGPLDLYCTSTETATGNRFNVYS